MSCYLKKKQFKISATQEAQAGLLLPRYQTLVLNLKKKQVGGWTNPFETYERQIGWFPQGSG